MYKTVDHIFRTVSWTTRLSIQLIKDQTQESVCHEVEFQLNLCSGKNISYQDLLKHASVLPFKGATMRLICLLSSTVLVRRAKELEEAFADGLQLSSS